MSNLQLKMYGYGFGADPYGRDDSELDDDGFDVVHGPPVPVSDDLEKHRARWFKATQAAWVRKPLLPAAEFWHNVSKKKPRAIAKFTGSATPAAQFFMKPPKVLAYPAGPAISTKVRGPPAPVSASRPAPYQAPRSVAYQHEYVPLTQVRKAPRAYVDANYYRAEPAADVEARRRARISEAKNAALKSKIRSVLDLVGTQ